MSKYAALSRDQLIARLESLEAGPSTTLPPNPLGKRVKKVKPAKAFTFAQNPTRHIALLISYHGWPYSGLSIQDSDDIPTVESELLKALERTKLVEEGKGWEGCKFARCGRTDRGVSSSGQVVTLYVRSSRKEPAPGWKPALQAAPPKPTHDAQGKEIVYQNVIGENTYPRLLNNCLPSTIRVLGWAPIDDDFDARFSCTSRHYKYGFHLQPTPGSQPLDLDAMQDGVQRLVGEHDFRNFCRLDGSKQLESHCRRVNEAWFGRDEAYPGMIVFNLIGSAFLWHQVRHIIGILFVIGSRLEPPSLIDELLDVTTNPSKPAYHMGHPLPLTLVSCGYAGGEPEWRMGSFDGDMKDASPDDLENELRARNKLERNLEAIRQEAEIRAWQVARASKRVEDVYGPPACVELPPLHPLGAGEVQTMERYRPIMGRGRGETPDEVNRKWRERKHGKGTGEVMEELQANT